MIVQKGHIILPGTDDDLVPCGVDCDSREVLNVWMCVDADGFISRKICNTRIIEMSYYRIIKWVVETWNTMPFMLYA